MERIKEKAIDKVLLWLKYRHLDKGKVLLGTVEAIELGVETVFTAGFMIDEQDIFWEYATPDKTSYEHAIDYIRANNIKINIDPFYSRREIEVEGVRFIMVVLFIKGDKE